MLNTKKHWHVYIDGASSGNPGESGAGIVVYDEKGMMMFQENAFLGNMTNNMAEYEALIMGLKKAHSCSIEKLTIYTDSLLVANQIKGIYKIKNSRLAEYYRDAKKLLSHFESFAIQYIPRERNTLADKLAKSAIQNRGGRVVAPFIGEESPGIAGQNGP